MVTKESGIHSTRDSFIDCTWVRKKLKEIKEFKEIKWIISLPVSSPEYLNAPSPSSSELISSSGLSLNRPLYSWSADFQGLVFLVGIGSSSSPSPVDGLLWIDKIGTWTNEHQRKSQTVAPFPHKSKRTITTTDTKQFVHHELAFLRRQAKITPKSRNTYSRRPLEFFWRNIAQTPQRNLGQNVYGQLIWAASGHIL